MAVGAAQRTARDEKAHARRTAAQARCGQTTVPFGLAAGGRAPAQNCRRSQPGNLQLPIAQKEASRSASARGPLSVAHQSARRRPEAEQKMLLAQLNLNWPEQPPPRLNAKRELEM